MDIPLGKQTGYPSHYDAALLFPVSRAENRGVIGVAVPVPFEGYDHWRAYELSWLDSVGMPQVGMADILVPCSSPNLIESKSMKLYFNSLNQHRFPSRAHLSDCIRRDLSAVAGMDVGVDVFDLDSHRASLALQPVNAQLLDRIQVTEPVFEPSAGMLRRAGSAAIDTTYVSHLFRSNCPVTSQPDWGTIVIEYRGPEPDKAALLRYILSYRLHEGFHEHCVERIFVELLAAFSPEHLVVSINFTRRGGLEINPIRSLHAMAEMRPLARFVRQ